MLPVRRAPSSAPNNDFVKQAWNEPDQAAFGPEVESNVAWLARGRAEQRGFDQPGDVVLVPRGRVHSFTRGGTTPAVTFVTFTPPLDAPDSEPAIDSSSDRR